MSPIRPGQDWGSPFPGAPDEISTGGDADLAAAVARRGPERSRLPLGWRPDPGADFARAVGLAAGASGPGGTAVPVDALAVEDLAARDSADRRGEGASEDGSGPAAVARPPGLLAVNAVVLGVAPARLRYPARSFTVTITVDGRPSYDGAATTVVVANGQFLDGRDVVPRGHPGDGRAEVQIYALTRGERARMRHRLATGTHLPHPRIFTRTGHVVEVHATRPMGLTVDGVRRTPVRHLRVAVVPDAFTLLV